MRCYSKIEHNDSLLFDFFRGASALTVFGAHLYQVFVESFYPRPIVMEVVHTVALYAVMVFFVMSGFMIVSSIYRNASSCGFAGFGLGKFARDRLLRLYPPLLFALLCVVFAHWVFRGLSNWGLSWERVNSDLFAMEAANLGGVLLFLNGLVGGFETPRLDGPLWSLSHEFWFYCAGAAICLLLVRDWKGLPLLLVVGAVFVLAEERRYLLAGFFVWSAGGVLALVYQNEWLTRRWLSRLLIFGSVVGFALWVACVISPFSWARGVSKYVFGLEFCLVLAWLLSSRFHVQRGMSEWRWFLGVASTARFAYTLYVIHWPLLILMLAVLGGWITNWFILTAVIVGASVVLLGLSSQMASRLENSSNPPTRRGPKTGSRSLCL